MIESSCRLKLGNALEFFEGVHHTLFRGICCSSEISTIFSMSREPHDDNACEKSKYYLEYCVGHHIRKMRYSLTFFSPREEACDESCSYLREYDDKRIENSGNECESDHITIEYMRHLMSDDTSNFRFFHMIEESSRHRDESTILRCACCESIGFSGFIVSDFRHSDIIRFCYTLYSFIYALEFWINGVE